MLDNIRATLLQDAPGWLAWGGLVIGIFFGFIVQRTNFCAMGSISDLMSFGDGSRLRAWLLAAATALAGAQIMQAYGIVDLSKSMYMAPTFDWAGAILGGLMFGFGMVFAGGCASRNLVRAGGGDLRSLIVVIVMGISAYVAIGGLIGPWRVALASATAIDLHASGMSNQGLGLLIAHASGMSASTASTLMTTVLVLAVLIFCFGNAHFRASPKQMVAGFGVGLAVCAGWALSGLAYDDLANTPIAPLSLTFVRPAGDTLDWMQRYTAGPVPTFGVTTTLGALIGALIAALSAGKFRVSTFVDKHDTMRNLFGAIMMGFGGVIGLGCTMGQCITGVSTLAIASYLVFAAIFTGGVVGVKVMEHMA